MTKPPTPKLAITPAPRRVRLAGPSAMLKVAAVAERLDASERHVRRLIAAGDLPVHRIGRSVRVSEEDLARLLQRARQ
jgi:excisionase family DNA binding protein